MKHDDSLERYLELCRRIQQRMLCEGTWQWPPEVDSRDSEDVIESDDL